MMPTSLLPSPALIPAAAPALGALLPILGAIFVALVKMMIKMVRPSSLKTFGQYLWRRKVGASIFFACLAGGVFAIASIGGASKSGGTAIEGADWTAYRGGPPRRAYAGGEDPVTGGVQWDGPFTDGDVKTFYASPAAVGNRVYISSADLGLYSDRGGIYCINADTGGMFWRYSPRNFRATYSSPSVFEDYVVCGEGLHETADARITCLKQIADDQVKLLWEYRTNSHVESSPCIAEGNVYIGAGDDGMYCIALEPTNGGQPKIKWQLSGKDYPDCETSPIVVDGKVYFGLGEGGHAIVCVRADNGAEVWRTPAPYPVFGSPAFDAGKVFVAMGNGNMIQTAEVVRDARIKKMREQGISEEEIAKAAEKLGPAGEVWALDARTGKVVWTFKTARTILGTVGIADKKIYFGTRDGEFYCLDTEKGKELDVWDAGEPIITSPAVGKNYVYCVSEEGTLYALPRDNLGGGPVWEATVGNQGPFTSSPVVARGHVYVGTGKDGFVCVGEPGTVVRKPFWGGFLGGSGQCGWTDGSPLADRGVFAWRHPKRPEDAPELPEGTPEATMSAPAAVAGGAIFAAVRTPEKVGLAMIVPPEDRRGSPDEKWFYPTANPVSISPAVLDNRVFVVDGAVGQEGRQLAAIGVSTGKAVTRPIAAGATGQMCISRGRLYVFDAPDRLSCVPLTAPDGAKGSALTEKLEPLWQAKVASPVGMPAVWGDDDIILVSSAALPGVIALDGVRGRVLWQAKLSVKLTPADAERVAAIPTTGPIAREDVVVVGTDKGLVPLHLADGTLGWPTPEDQAGATASESPAGDPVSPSESAPLPTVPIVGPLVADRWRIAAATGEGKVLIASWAGRLQTELTDVMPGAPPVLVRDQALVVRKGTLDRVDLESGESSSWYKYDWLGRVSAPPVMADSHVFFGTDQKGLIVCRPRKN